MVMAYIAMNVQADSDVKVLEDLGRLEEVREASLVYGLYDIICKVEVEGLDDLKNLVKRIRRIDFVIAMQTILAYKTVIPKN